MTGPEVKYDQMVLPAPGGIPRPSRRDYRSFRRLTEKAVLRRVTLHDLRHTAASLLLAQGVAARVVMEILGNSQISITMNTYTHVDPQLNRIATDRWRRRCGRPTECIGLPIGLPTTQRLRRS